MPTSKMEYIIFFDDEMLATELEDGDAKYFREILPHLKPLSDEEYMNGVAVILQTGAAYSYVLYENNVYWCVEWAPGLVVVRFSPDGKIAACALRSPVPDFDGRTPNAEDATDYDDTVDNPQYNLVYRAWDALFDDEWREANGFKKTDDKTKAAYEASLRHVFDLGEKVATAYQTEEAFNEWRNKCKEAIDNWSGDGIRLSV